MSKQRADRALAKHIQQTNSTIFKKSTNIDTAPHLIVMARAGTGKTTTMIEGLKLLFDIPSKITPSPQQQAIWDCLLLSKPHFKTVCFVAFNKSIATELQGRVPAGVDASTMHSMGLRAVTATYGKIAINQNRVDDIAVALLPQFHDVWDLRRKRPGLLPLVSKLVDLCKMNLLEGTPEECYQIVADHAMNPGEDETILPEAVELVPEILKKCADIGNSLGDRCIDFADMIWLPVHNKLSVKKYDLLLVDECQDLNRCQQALAKKAGHRLILVGDDRQAIYGFAGTDSESMGRMMVELSKTICPRDTDGDGNCGNRNCLVCGGDGSKLGRGCVILPLTVTRRCGKAIVEEARKIVPDFEAHPDNVPGKISYASLGETV